MLLTKGETDLGVVKHDVAEMIINHLNEAFGLPIIREALASGYVRIDERYIAKYNGRFGCGITVRYHNYDSTRYCEKCTMIYNATAEEISEVIEYCFRKAGLEKSWKVTF